MLTCFLICLLFDIFFDDLVFMFFVTIFVPVIFHYYNLLPLNTYFWHHY